MAEFSEMPRAGTLGARTQDLELVIPRFQHHAGWDQVGGIAFARLARGELREDASLMEIVALRANAIGRLCDPVFSKIFTQFCRTESVLKLSDSHLDSGAPEGLTIAAERYSHQMKLLDSNFAEEANEQIDRAPGLKVAETEFANLAAKGIEDIGEFARKLGTPILFELLRRENPSEDFLQTVNHLRTPVKSLSVPLRFEFRSPQPGTRDAEELTDLLSLMAYVGLEKLAVVGRADVLSLYLRTSEMLIDLGVATPSMLHLPQAIEGAVQIEALAVAVNKERAGFGRARALFLTLIEGLETFGPVLEKSLARINRHADTIVEQEDFEHEEGGDPRQEAREGSLP